MIAEVLDLTSKLSRYLRKTYKYEEVVCHGSILNIN